MRITRDRSFLAVPLVLLALFAGACAPQPTPPGTAEDLDSEQAVPASGQPAPAAANRPASGDSYTPPRAATPRAATPPLPVEPSRPVEPPAPTFVVVDVPAGTEIEVELLDTLSSGTSQVGDSVRGRLSRDLVAGGRVVAPAGGEVLGMVTEAVPLPKFGGQAKLALTFDRLEVTSGESVSVAAMFVQEGPKQAARDAAKIGGGAAAGAIVGHQVDSDKGKVIGAIIGGAIGTAAAAKTGKEVEIPSGTMVVVPLDSAVRVRLES